MHRVATTATATGRYRVVTLDKGRVLCSSVTMTTLNTTCGLCARIGTNDLGGPRVHAPGCPKRPVAEPNPIAALCPQWLRDRANLLRSKAHEVEHAYNGDAIAPWLVRTATAYRRAAAVLEVEADTMLAEFAAARKGD